MNPAEAKTPCEFSQHVLAPGVLESETRALLRGGRGGGGLRPFAFVSQFKRVQSRRVVFQWIHGFIPDPLRGIVLETRDGGGCVRVHWCDNCALVLLVPAIRLGFGQGLQRARDVAGGTVDTGLDDSVDRRLTAEPPTGESIGQQIFPARLQ